MANFRWNINFTKITAFLTENIGLHRSSRSTDQSKHNYSINNKKYCNHMDPYAKIAATRSTMWPTITNDAKVGGIATVISDTLDDIEFCLEAEYDARINPKHGITHNRKYF